jgi:amino acid adenylation domain-containing protein
MPDPADPAPHPGGVADSRRQHLREQVLARMQRPAEPAEPAEALSGEMAANDTQFDPFPMLDLQQAYWVGRTQAPHGSPTACHGYFELDMAQLDLTRLEQACNKLIKRHPMLRAVIDRDGKQRVLKEVPHYRLPVLDLLAHQPDAALERVRAEMSHQVLPADTWPLFDIRVTRLPDGIARLHISFDILIADALSFEILATELVELYSDPQQGLRPIEVTFRDYVVRVMRDRQTADHQSTRSHWRTQLTGLPAAPDLPLCQSLPEIESPRFRRLEAQITGEQWRSLCNVARESSVSTACAVLAAFADTLGMWASSPKFTLNLTVFDRAPVHPHINQVVGPFTSNTLLPIDLVGHQSVRNFVASLQRDLWRNLEHRDFTGVQAMRELSRLRGAEVSMPVVFTHVRAPGRLDFRQALERLGSVRFAISQTPQVVLDCQVLETPNSATLLWDVVSDAFDAAMLEEMFTAFTDAVKLLAHPPIWARPYLAATPVSAIADRSSAETLARLPLRPLHELVAACAEAAPDAPAVVDPDAGTVLSHGEFTTLSQGVAHGLLGSGIEQGQLVGVYVDPGWPLVAAVVGTCASGAAYLPLDTALPERRLAAMVAAAGVNTIVIGPSQAPVSWFSGQTVRVTRPTDVMAAGGLPSVPLDQLAYVMFTSGSTGEPKGVRMTHAAAANTIVDVNARYKIGPRDRVLAVSSIGFDLSVWDIFGMLAAGGAIVTPGRGGTAKDPDQWLARLAAERITVWNSVPTLMSLLVELAEARDVILPDLRLVLLSGDWIPLDLPARIGRVAPSARIVSLGGATEAAIWSVAYDISSQLPAWPSVPYGKPLTNQRAHVLDALGRERPCQVPGELYLGGAGVADGYWQAPELTSHAFPQHQVHGRLYRTGDLVRRHRGGCLELLGRMDSQVKIHGFRVELSEIDATLMRLPGVRSSVTEATGPRDGHRQLVSFVVPGTDRVSGDQLRAELARTLPSYLVPARIIVVSQLPLTANGKVDRHRLRGLAGDPPAAPAAGAVSPPEQPTPVLPAEENSPLRDFLLAWARRWLSDDSISADTNLVLTGLDSIDLVRMLNAFERDVDFRPSLADLIRAPTVGSFQRLLEEELVRMLHRHEGLRATGREGQGAELDAGATLARAATRQHVMRILPGIRLPGPPGDDRQAFETERTCRAFASLPVAMAQFSRLLAPLRAIKMNGQPKYRYPSAGDSYAVTTLVHVKVGRVGSLRSGIYFYNPLEHQLSMLADDVCFDVDGYGLFSNRATAEQAAFAIYLVADLDALLPHYGERSAQFAALEAGAMAMLLRHEAPAQGVGLCQVGMFDDSNIRAALSLDARQPVVASMLGGQPDGSEHYEEGDV